MQINDLKTWVSKCIDDCTGEGLNDRDFITSAADQVIFHSTINSVCNPGDNKDVMPTEQCTFDTETKNDLPSTVQLFYEESRDNEPLVNVHLQAIGSGFSMFVSVCQERDDNSLKLSASLPILPSYSNAYADLSETVYTNENNENYLKAQSEKLSQRDMKKYLGEMKCLVDRGEMNFDGYLDEMSYLVNGGALDPDILSKMRSTISQLVSFVKLFDSASREEIKIFTDTSKLIYDLFGVKSEK